MQFVSGGSIFYRNATYYCTPFHLQRGKVMWKCLEEQECGNMNLILPCLKEPHADKELIKESQRWIKNPKLESYQKQNFQWWSGLAVSTFTETWASVCLLGFFITCLYLSHLEAMAFIPGTCMPLPATGWPKALVRCWVTGQRCCKLIAPRQGTGTPQSQDTEFFAIKWWQLTVVCHHFKMETSSQPWTW